MTEEEPIVSSSEPSQGLFARLLNLWGGYRRLLTVVVVALGLGGFLWSLEPETRRALVRGLWANQALIILLLIFVLLTLSLLWSAGQRLDTWVFLLFNLRGHHPLWLDRLMWTLTQIGNGVFGILLGIFLYFADRRRLAVELLLGILSLWLVVEIMKALVERRRPFITMEGARIVGWRERGLSFPSGHTAQSFFMAVLFAQYLQAGALIGGVFYGFAAAVGMTRIYVGAHYPRDVLGGAILGSIWGILSRLIQAYLTTGQF